RNRISSCHPVRRRMGVMHSVAIRNRNVQIPVVSRISSSGFALNCWFTAAQTNRVIGIRHATKTIALSLENLLEIHAGIQMCHLLCISVEHQRGLRCLTKESEAAFAQPLLARLVPSRMTHRHVDVGVKAVGLWP